MRMTTLLVIIAIALFTASCQSNMADRQTKSQDSALKSYINVPKQKAREISDAADKRTKKMEDILNEE